MMTAIRRASGNPVVYDAPSEAGAQSVPMWERIIAVYCLFHYSQGLWGMILTDPTSTEGSPLMRLLWYPIYIFGLFGLVRGGKESLRAIFASPILLGLLALAFASSMWSPYADVTFRRAFALAMTSLFGVYLAARYDWKGMITIIASSFALMSAAGFIGSLTVPSLFIDHVVHIGAWLGVWIEKNFMGGLMARGVVACLCAMLVMPHKSWTWRSFAALCAFMVLMSTSKTSLLALLVGAAIVTALLMVRKSALHAFTFGYGILALMLGGAALVLFTPDAFFEMLGRDPSLTGRTQIWHFVLQTIQDRPLFGQGYGAFWYDENGPATYIRQALKWEVPNAHNGWLDLTLDMGVTGLILGVIYYAIMLWRAFARFNDRIVGPFAIGLLMLGIVFSLSESAIAQQNSLGWVLVVAIGAKLAMDANEARDAARLQAAHRALPQRRRSASVG